MLSHAPSTTARPSSQDELVTITHPFHPLTGKSFSFLGQRYNWGEDRIAYRDEEGTYRTVPTGWTDRAPLDTFVVLSGGRAAFRFSDLVTLGRDLKSVN